MKLSIEISMNNEAFRSPHEVRRCLARIAEEVSEDGRRRFGTVRDSNGNMCGTWHIRQDGPQELGQNRV